MLAQRRLAVTNGYSERQTIFRRRSREDFAEREQSNHFPSHSGVVLHMIPGATIKEISHLVFDLLGESFCESTIRNFMVRRELTGKKDHIRGWTRSPWCKSSTRELGLSEFQGRKLLFYRWDGATTDFTRTQGRCLKGQGLESKIPHRHYKNCTCVAALTANGMVACKSYDWLMNSGILKEYVENEIKPHWFHRAVVIWDNCSPRRNAEVRRIIESTGAKLVFWPPKAQTLIRSKWRFLN